mgnify:FL=1|tara:strand:- start:398 stop:748 length:351 start_codon:yes stop_codon:yes gene_type:complete
MSNKDRGRTLENECADFGNALGIPSHRVFGSGQYKNQLGEAYSADVVIGKYRVECKRRKSSGFTLLYKAFEQDSADMLCIRQDRARRLWVLEEHVLAELLGAYYYGKTDDSPESGG